MLPVVKRKTLQVPHGLAAIAAGICLVLAFASDFQDREQRLQAELEPNSNTELVAERRDSSSQDQSVQTESRRQQAEDRRERMTTGGLIRWFPLHWNGG